MIGHRDVVKFGGIAREGWGTNSKSLHYVSIFSAIALQLQRRDHGTRCMNIWQQDQAPRTIDEQNKDGAIWGNGRGASWPLWTRASRATFR